MKSVFFILTVILITLIVVAYFLASKKENGIESNLKMQLEELLKLEPLNRKLTLNSTRKLVILFSPDCDLCEEEFQSIDGNFDKIPDIQIILISPYPRIQVDNFVRKYNFCKSSSTTVLLGNHNFLNRMFDQYSFPTIFIVDENNRVNRRFNDVISIKAIYRQLQVIN